MKTIMKEEQCLVCKGTGQRSWLYRYWEDIGGLLISYTAYNVYWDTFSTGGKIAFAIMFFGSIISIIIEKNKNKRGKCKNCNGTGKIILEEVIEEE